MEAQRPGAARLAAWLGGDIDEALEGVGLPAWLVDRRGIVRWQNIRASELFGDFVGRPAWEGFAADSQEIAQREFTKKLLGTGTRSDYEAVMRSRSGSRIPVEVHSVAVRGGDRVVGIFGLAEAEQAVPPPLVRPLTPRQLQVLRALAAGSSTAQIAEALHISTETVRNHVRALLRALRVHSRLEAVVEGRRRGLLD